MKKVNISITKSEILEEVALNSSYTGAKSPQADTVYERVATISEDSVMLTRFWQNLGNRIIEKFRSLITSSRISDENLQIEMEVSGSFDESLSQSVASDISGAMAAGVTALWFRITLHEQEEEWQKQCDVLLERAHRKLFLRKKPQKPHDE